MIEYAIKKVIDECLSVDCTPSFGMGNFPIVTYTHTPVSGGVLKESQFEIRLIDQSLDMCLELKEKLNIKLDMLDNVPSLVINNFTLRSKLAGGGQLFNDIAQAWEVSLIYIIKWRKLNGK